MEYTARQLAYQVLCDIEMKGAYANLALDKALLRSKLNATDRRLATELVYGCTKMKQHLDHVISYYCDLKKINLKTLLILRMAVYQMNFLKKIPGHAIVNESVEIAKSEDIHSDKLVNAVLRSMLREEKNVKWPDKRKQRNQFFAKWYSFPQWIIDMWSKEYGFSNTEKLCQFFNEPSETWVRINTLKTSIEDVSRFLDKNGIHYIKHSAFNDALLIRSFQKVQSSSLIKEGKIFVQDLSAMLPAYILNPKENYDVLDMCAAPGGKTTQLSAIMNNKGEITACDVHPHRVQLIKDNMKRLGCTNISCKVCDTRKLDLNKIFDAILLDAPCSGLGVLNRRADLRWRIHRNNLNEIIVLQQELLDTAAACLKSGGNLVYSTCTLNRAENEEQIMNFLKRHPDFSLVPFECLDHFYEAGYVTIYPFIDHTDGFFIAKLTRKE